MNKNNNIDLVDTSEDTLMEVKKLNNSKKSVTEARVSSMFVIIFIIILMTLFVFINLIRGYFSEKLVTENIEYNSFYDSVDTYGIAIRNERIVSVDRDYNNIMYQLSNGDRVAKRSIIASCSTVQFSNEDIIKIINLDRRISQLEDSLNTSVSVELTALEKNIINYVNDFLYYYDKKDLNESLNSIDKLHVLFNKKEIKIDGDLYLKDILNDYKKEKDDLLNKYNTSETLVSSPYAGYLYIGTDGYEYLKPEDYNEITVAAFKELIAVESVEDETYNNVIAKIETSPSWYFYCMADSSKVGYLNVGQKINLEFEFEHIGKVQIPFTVAYVSRSIDGNTALKLRSDVLTDYIFSMRKENAKIILSAYNGFRISPDALRVVDGNAGVYVLSAKRVVFKPVNIIYSADSFVIVTPAVSSGRKMLAVKDAVILGGKDIYDGKIVQ